MTSELIQELGKLKQIKEQEFGISNDKYGYEIEKKAKCELGRKFEISIGYQYINGFKGQLDYIKRLSNEDLKSKIEIIKDANREYEEFKKNKPILEEIINQDSNEKCIEIGINYLRQRLNGDEQLDKESYEYKYILSLITTYYKEDILEKEIINPLEKKEETDATKEVLYSCYAYNEKLSKSKMFKKSLMHNVTRDALDTIEKLCKNIEKNREIMKKAIARLKDKETIKRY